MSPATQPELDERENSNHHIVVKGQDPGGYGNVSVLTTIVGALNDDDSLREYWWDVTPDVAPISKIDSPNDVRTILWQLSGRLIEGTDDLPGFGFHHAKGGVVITDPAWTGPQPQRNGDFYVLVLKGEQPNSGKYAYSISFEVNGRSYGIDPELELGEE